MTDIREGRETAICKNCGTELENFNIKSIETGSFYCSEECAKEDIKANEPEGGY